MADPQDGRQRIPARSKFEEDTGFTRALRAGPHVFVSGTVGTEADGTISPDTGRQATRAFELIKSQIEELGGHMGDVVRVRMFVVDIKDAEVVSAPSPARSRRPGRAARWCKWPPSPATSSRSRSRQTRSSAAGNKHRP